MPSELSDREIPEGYLQQEIKTSCRIQSCKSTPQPLTGRGRPRRGAYRFEPEIVKKAEMQGAVPGCSCCRAFPMITTMSIKDPATMTGRLHLSLFVFLLQFIFGSFGRKECLNTPRPVHHELAVTVSHRATPILSPQLSGVEGVDFEEADHQCWLVVVSNIVFFRVFSVEYSNNLSINELCTSILRGNLYICPHNCIVCVRMAISFYPATRIHVHFSHEVRSFCATSCASFRRWPGPVVWAFLTVAYRWSRWNRSSCPSLSSLLRSKFYVNLNLLGTSVSSLHQWHHFEVSLQAFSIYQRK